MLLGIDLGTGSVKALVMAADGSVIGEASRAYPVQAPQPGWAESNPQDWWAAVTLAVQQAVGSQTEAIEAIGLSGQMHGVVLSDPAGDALTPAILWADTRSGEVLDRFTNLSTEQRRQLANPITTGMAAASLLWLKLHQPQPYQAARWVLQPKDWLRLRLTGAVAAEPSDASGTLMYDVVSDRWAIEVLEVLELRSDWLPPLIPSSQIAGSLTPTSAEQLGLLAGIPVIAGAADTAAAALGSGLLQPGLVQLTIGTGAQIMTVRSQPALDPSGRTHLYRTALPQQWYTLAAMQNAGLALEWVRTILGMSWSEVYAEAFSVAPGCDGLTFLPYLTGERTPHLDPQARGAWAGLGLHHQRAHLMRSALEGVAFSLRQGLAALTATGVTVADLRLAGGGTLEPVWRQLLADILQVPLGRVTVASASARGAAILAGLGIGQYPDGAIAQLAPAVEQVTTPKPANAALEAAWQRFCELYPALRPLTLQ